MSAIQNSKVNMSLDDIIKQSKKDNNNRFRRGNRRNFGERRRYKNNTGDLKQNNSEEKTEKRTRLFVSNLQKDIVNSELRKIFSGVGTLKRCSIHWDTLGFSKGTADIEYEKPEEAQKAIKDFNEAEIEGVPMKVDYSKSRSRKNSRRNDRGRRDPRQRNSMSGMSGRRNERRGPRNLDSRRNRDERRNRLEIRKVGRGATRGVRRRLGSRIQRRGSNKRI